VLPVARVSAPATAIQEELVLLDGTASTGGTNFRWTQVSGPWVALGGADGERAFRATVAGSYGFELVVDDGSVRSAPVAVTVVVNAQ
jgi:hypothetical protein